MILWIAGRDVADIAYNGDVKHICLSIAIAALLIAVVGATPVDHLKPARQLVLVITPGWDDVHGELRRFERRAATDTWKAVGSAAAIAVGKNGSAWDSDIVRPLPGPVKAEGDGRSPAGVFTLGTAFGFVSAPDASWLKMPYLHVIEGIECVDDSSSKVYNQIVNRRTIASPDWNSSEKMREVGEAYRWGVVINYNSSPAVAKRGSCIFLHIGGEHGTAGCTATSPDQLRAVMEWLDLKQNPVMVQLPKAAYEKLRGAWNLP
jgi:L,D-peptidoglycan transpeptidase YkuD (ErfK/YbiS/YcfS/YnhG family)